MPFKSEQQRRYLFANKPEIARRWAKNYADGGIVEDIAISEGFSDTAYQDVAGVWTIGYGRTTNPGGVPIRPGQRTTREAEKRRLERRVGQDRDYVERYGKRHGYNWSAKQIDALTSFTYNLGKGSLDQVTKNGRRTNDEIAGAIPKYNKAGGQFIQGLQNRRDRESALFTGGDQETRYKPITSSPTLIAPRVDPRQADRSDVSFGNAFQRARKEQGAGGTFSWKGKEYSTNVRGESGSKPSKPSKPSPQRSSPQRPSSQPTGRVSNVRSRYATGGGYVMAPLNMQDGGRVGSAADIDVFDVTAGTFGEYGDTGAKSKLTPENMEFLLGFVPIIGDALTIRDIIRELQKDPVNKVVVAGLVAALIVGLVPGVGDALAVPIKAAVRAAGKIVPSDIIGIIRAVRDGDVEFLKGWGVPDDVAASVGAKVAKETTFYVRKADGTVETHLMTPAAFAKYIGKSESATKKATGKTKDGLPWARKEEDLAEISERQKKKTLVADAEPIDPKTVKPTPGARMSWKGIPDAVRNKIEEGIDKRIFDNADAKATREGRIIDGDGVSKKGYDVDDIESGDPIAMDWDYKAKFQEDNGAEVWPKLVEFLDDYSGAMSVDQMNKLLVWSRTRANKLFDKVFEDKVTEWGAYARSQRAHWSPARKIREGIADGVFPEFFEQFPTNFKNILAETRFLENMRSAYEYGDGKITPTNYVKNAFTSLFNKALPKHWVKDITIDDFFKLTKHYGIDDSMYREFV